MGVTSHFQVLEGRATQDRFLVMAAEKATKDRPVVMEASESLTVPHIQEHPDPDSLKRVPGMTTTAVNISGMATAEK
jgi:hypothetical protein